MVKQGLKILIATMQLGIGGAETHIVELAKELDRRGYSVVVASNGGDYVKELEEAGIKHYKVPLQNKNPFNMAKAAKLLKQIILSEKIEIVHSHARIPSFILGRLHKRMGFPFVTTAHWVFNTGYGLKYITDWGEKTVAVSEDIKKYLMDNYKIPEGDIRVTINGIDTDKFSADTECGDIKAELGINDGDRVITYMSRLDESRSLAAKQLIEAAPELAKEIRGLKIIVVGGGDDFKRVKELALRANSKTGRETVVLTGPRTDVNKLIAVCELFIGVSRSALEAMSAEKPVIIAGNEGYIGLFDESKLKIGIDTNFCCRGCEMSSAALIKRDVLSYFAMDAAGRRRIGSYGRDLIKREYSVGRMADDTLQVYEWALGKNDEILISGYYGFHNSGDDALLSAIIQDLNKYKGSPNIVVLSANPKETRREYGVKSINRFDLFSIRRHMKKADMLISGGGTLIQDRTSNKSLWYYLMIIRSALGRDMRVMLYANGIGPLSGGFNRRITRKVLDKVDLITLRDDGSARYLKDLGVDMSRSVVTADPALNLAEADSGKGRDILAAAGVPEGVKLMGVSVRRWNGVGQDFERVVAEACDWATQKYGYYPVLLPMQMSKDLTVSQNIMRRMSSKASIIDTHQRVEDMLSVVGCMDICVGMRLHTLIYSVIKAVPLVGLVYDPKISSFMDYTHQRMYTDVSELTADKLKELIAKTVEEYEQIRRDIRGNYEKLRAKSEMNGQLAIELYEKGSVEI